MIGQWVARFVARKSGLVRVTLWHLVESQISDRQVVRSGQQMGHIEGTELAFSDNPPIAERCSVCDRGR